AGAAQLGQKVVLIERHKMGGDCLNYGCVPSKSLIAAAAHAQAVRRAPEFGVDAGEPKTDFARVMKHVHDVIAAIEPNDSVERFEKLGVRVVKASARFVGPHEVEAGDLKISARYFIVATGSSPLKPPIPGLEQTPYFTNETLFDNTVLPEHLIIIGGGPIGIELAQAHRRLGSRVTVLEAKQILPKDDVDAVAIVREALTKDGVVIREGASVTAVAKTESGVSVTIMRNGQSEIVTGSHLLLAAGRTPNVDGLNLEAAGVKYSRKGIEVDAGLRTANSRVYAIGDVAGGLQFTHVAGYHAGIIIRRLLFKVPAKANAVTPWCTYTDPELAHVGLTEASAREKGLTVSIARWPLHDNDRAQAERELHGLAKVVVVKGRVVGATIVAPHAGDLILPWVMAVGQKMKLSAMAGLVAPYPTLSEISKRAAGSYFTPTLFSGRTRGLIKVLSWFGPRR
ncbi:MAG: FAD-dependent oxidoreductase, partial [Alphaproteobacteria bacterium]|nr:FAD-dependent oxidoreductase [Alphaproteobacteria bacterium]